MILYLSRIFGFAEQIAALTQSTRMKSNSTWPILWYEKGLPNSTGLQVTYHDQVGGIIGRNICNKTYFLVSRTGHTVLHNNISVLIDLDTNDGIVPPLQGPARWNTLAPDASAALGIVYFQSVFLGAVSHHHPDS